jgi:hypothetical protein
MKACMRAFRGAQVGVLSLVITMLGASAKGDSLDHWHRRDAGASNYISALTYNPAV